MNEARETLYESMQLAWPFVIIGGVVLLLVVAFSITRQQPVAAAAAVLLAIILVFFSTMKVEISRESVNVRFGPLPLIGRSIDVDRIQDVELARSHWWNGWGVRMISGGTLYNAANLNVVEITLPDHRRVQIGTPEPEALRAALDRARRAGNETQG